MPFITLVMFLYLAVACSVLSTDENDYSICYYPIMARIRLKFAAAASRARFPINALALLYCELRFPIKALALLKFDAEPRFLPMSVRAELYVVHTSFALLRFSTCDAIHQTLSAFMFD